MHIATVVPVAVTNLKKIELNATAYIPKLVETRGLLLTSMNL